MLLTLPPFEPLLSTSPTVNRSQTGSREKEKSVVESEKSRYSSVGRAFAF
jgi:hypothetical protein